MLAPAGQQTRSFSTSLQAVLAERLIRRRPDLVLAAIDLRLRVMHEWPHRFADALRLPGPCKPAT
ncbi:MAG TPA: hypothetical protein VMD92_04480 [Acidobacteriaceae bacterium]|jgi:hypothetical protein|nr:hypothetical protein [Acidobacteriaceae bacterium]